MMKRLFTENQIISILKEADSGIPIAELPRKYGLGNSTMDHWRAQYGGMAVSDLKALKRLKGQNCRLKDLHVKILLEHRMLQ